MVRLSFADRGRECVHEGRAAVRKLIKIFEIGKSFVERARAIATNPDVIPRMIFHIGEFQCA